MRSTSTRFLIPGSPAAEAKKPAPPAEWVTAPVISYDPGGFGLSVLCPPGSRRSPLERYERSWQTWVVTWLYDWARDIRVTWKTVVFVARYAGQDIDKLEQWHMSKLQRVAKFTGEYLADEDKEGRGGLGPSGGARG